MIVGFNYLAMTITGAMHLTNGIFCLICSIIGFTTQKYYNYHGFYYDSYLYDDLSVRIAAGSFIASLWIIAVGILGISTGLKSNPEHRTNSLKIAYMVLAILSACFFAIAGMTCFSIHSVWILYYGIYGLHVLFACAAFVMSVEFILAIVSSSICCCCSGTRIIAVGILGILTGLKSNPEHRTNSLKIAYMVLAILSACFFAIAGMTCFSIHSVWILYYGIYGLHVLFACAAFVMSVEFILAIVSSSICCCCSGTRQNKSHTNLLAFSD
ncbi:Hypothetical predicted protein [Octopus vulgaris]|uniref:Uncharacterized protein n=1 Tax=Octopus vulgaris TaxID=6645 RepID=A0AA36B8P2_OCTVU|nr:Hypothetical predicted protein [Octopus vulgaris]